MPAPSESACRRICEALPDSHSERGAWSITGLPDSGVKPMAKLSSHQTDWTVDLSDLRIADDITAQSEKPHEMPHDVET